MIEAVSDHDRLIRIETLVEGLTTAVINQTESLERHIENEENELRGIRDEVKNAATLRPDVDVLKLEVKELQSMKNKALGWIAAIIFAGGIFWELVIHPLKAIKGGG